MVSCFADSNLAWKAFTSIVFVALVPVVYSQPTLPPLLSSQELVYGTIYWQQIGTTISWTAFFSSIIRRNQEFVTETLQPPPM
jgi:hypothetical protein